MTHQDNIQVKIKSDSNNISNRVHYLDAMRGVLMMLGVLLHSALVFSPQQTWLIHSENTTEVASFLVELIHIFRMPAFFIISGYFALFTIRKYGPDLFMKVRLKRILVPLFSTALTLNIAQAILLKGSDWQTFYLDGEWISHLWFLWNLVFYFIVIIIAFKFFNTFFNDILEKIDQILLKLPFLLIVFLLPSLSIALLVIGKIFPATIFGIDLSGVLNYFPYFLFGMLLLEKEDLLNKFSHIKPVITISLAIIAYLFYSACLNHDGILWLSARVYLQDLSGWFGAAACFYFFMKYANKPSSILYYLADASYTIYLFHQVLVVGFGLILIKLNIGGVAGLLILIVSVAIVSLLIHTVFISKIKLLRFLFNGK